MGKIVPLIFLSLGTIVSIALTSNARLLQGSNKRSPVSPLAVSVVKIVAPSQTSTATQLKSEAQKETRKETPATTEAKAAPVKSITLKRERLNFVNNKFGVHAFANTADLELAAQLINTHGGDWGWVTLSLDLNENSRDRWNNLFKKMAELRLIPILQISNNGLIPNPDEMDKLVRFLSELNWSTKIRVVTAFSEVNASEYWGGKIDPEGYATMLNRLIDQLKQRSEEFFVLNGAFNASAQTSEAEKINCIKTDLGVDTCYLSEIGYLKRMNAAVPGIFKKLDGWAVHTYPHPNYKGKPADRRIGRETAFEAGRNTIRSYQFELRLLKRDYGVALPVFITETGWPHREGKTAHPEWYDAETVAKYYAEAFKDIFLPDPRVVAVTPFILRRDDFDNFTFVSSTGEKFPQWFALQNFPKIPGDPPR